MYSFVVNMLNMKALKILIQHFANHSVENEFLHVEVLKLGMCSKELKNVIDNHFWEIKVFWSCCGTDPLLFPLKTQWMYLSKSISEWKYNFHIDYNQIDKAFTFTMVHNNRQLYVFSHINGHNSSISAKDHKSGIPCCATTNFADFWENEENCLVFHFSAGAGTN